MVQHEPRVGLPSLLPKETMSKFYDYTRYNRAYWTLLVSIVAIMPESVTYRLWHWMHIDLHWCKDGPKTFLRSLAQDICQTLELKILTPSHPWLGRIIRPSKGNNWQLGDQPFSLVWVGLPFFISLPEWKSIKHPKGYSLYFPGLKAGTSTHS